MADADVPKPATPEVPGDQPTKPATDAPAASVGEQAPATTEAAPAADAKEGEAGKAVPKKKIKGKRMIVIIALVVLLLLGLGAGFFFSQKSKDQAKEEELKAKEKVVPVSQYYEMDPFIVNLNSLGDRGFLKMTVVLEVDNPEAILTIQNSTPKIRDSFNLYLRELRTEDLRGTAGTYRLKEELLLRLNTMLFPTVIKDILFKEIIVQ